jgi:hypothetical protein
VDRPVANQVPGEDIPLGKSLGAPQVVENVLKLYMDFAK